MPLLDEMLFQVVVVANPATVDVVAGARPIPHSPWDLGPGYWVATATVR